MNDNIKNALAIARATSDLTGDLAHALMTEDWARAKALDPGTLERAEAEANIANEYVEAGLLQATNLAMTGLGEIAKGARGESPTIKAQAAQAIGELTQQVKAARGGGDAASKATQALIGNVQGLLTGAVSDAKGQIYRSVTDPVKADLSRQLTSLLAESNYVDNVQRLNDLSQKINRSTLAIAGILGIGMQAAVKKQKIDTKDGMTIGIPSFLSDALPMPFRGANQVTLTKNDDKISLQAGELNLGGLTATTKLVKDERSSGISYKWDAQNGGFIRISGAATSKDGRVTGGTATANIGSRLVPVGATLTVKKDAEGTGGGATAYWENDRVKVTGQLAKYTTPSAPGKLVTEGSVRLDTKGKTSAYLQAGKSGEKGAYVEAGVTGKFGALPRLRPRERRGLHGNPKLVRKIAGPIPRLQSLFAKLRQRGELSAPDPVLEPQTPLPPETAQALATTPPEGAVSGGTPWGWIAAGIGVVGLVGGLVWMNRRSA